MPKSASKNKPVLSVVISNHNELPYIDRCLTSILSSTYEPMEVIVVDDESTDGGPQFISHRFGHEDRLRILTHEQRRGLCAVLNTGLDASKGKYILFTQMDGFVEADCFAVLVNAMESDSSIGAAQPKILYADRPDVILSTGSYPDYLGYPRGPIGKGEIDQGQYEEPREIFNGQDQCMIVRRDVLEEVGSWDASYGWFREEEDMGWRIRLGGYRVMYVPLARAYHKTTVSLPGLALDSAYNRFKNYLINLIKNYGIWNLMAFFPVALCGVLLRLFIGELLVMRRPRHVWAALKGLGWLIRNLNYVLKERRRIQKHVRKVSDKEIKRLMFRPSFIKYFNDILFMRRVFSGRTGAGGGVNPQSPADRWGE